jgi:Molybdopterin converting factor, large subunit
MDVIREQKRTLPVWKKEVFADGENCIEADSEVLPLPTSQS